MRSRRSFVLSLPAAALTAALPGTTFGQAPRLEESEPQAIALGYRHDASKVDPRKFPTFAPGRHCANCQLFQAPPSEAWGPCAAVGGKLVNAKGWCLAWVKNA